MNARESLWRIDNCDQPLAHDCVYSVARIASDGQRARDDLPTVVASGGSILVVLTASAASSRHSQHERMLRGVVEELIGCALDVSLSAGQQMQCLLQKFAELFWTRRVFLGCSIPSGFFVVLSPDCDVQIYRCGPVGAASLRNRSVSLLHLDGRFPSLRRYNSGPPFDEQSERLVGVVEYSMSSFYDLPPRDVPLVRSVVSQAESLILMNRAVLPFALPANGERVELWAEQDAGWRHGREGVIVEISRRGCSKLSRAADAGATSAGLSLLADDQSPQT